MSEELGDFIKKFYKECPNPSHIASHYNTYEFLSGN